MDHQRLDFTGFIAHVEQTLPDYEVRPGASRRRLRGSAQADAYGCADAVNIAYTLGRLPGDAPSRADLAAGIRSFQDAGTGIFRDETHSDYHTTAHCVAALELLDLRPGHPLTFLTPLLRPAALPGFLASLDWDVPWPASHDGAGVAAALAIVGGVDAAWFDAYFDWLDAEVSSDTGLWRKGRLLPVEAEPGLFANLAGSFHYHFNYHYFRRALPYPERVIDTALTLLEQSPVDIAVRSVGFKDIDWIFCVNRCERQSGHRREDVRVAVREVAGRMARLLNSPDYWATDTFDDLHTLFGALCALAELQLALPGEIVTPRPLRLVLDRRPFI